MQNKANEMAATSPVTKGKFNYTVCVYVCVCLFACGICLCVLFFIDFDALPMQPEIDRGADDFLQVTQAFLMGGGRGGGQASFLRSLPDSASLGLFAG